MKQLCLAIIICLAAGSLLGGCGEVTNDATDSSVPPSSDARPGSPDAGPSSADASQGATDASPPADASVPLVTLTHNTNPELVTTDAPCITCGNMSGHAENRYYRVFDLSEFGVRGNFQVVELLLGVEQAQSPDGFQPVQVQLHTLPDGAELTRGNLVFVGADSFDMPNRQLRVMTLALSKLVVIPANSNLVVEVVIPNGQISGDLLLVGCNDFGQEAPSYFYTPACGTTTPDITEFTTVNPDAGALVLSVRGIDLGNALLSP